MSRSGQPRIGVVAGEVAEKGGRRHGIDDERPTKTPQCAFHEICDSAALRAVSTSAIHVPAGNAAGAHHASQIVYVMKRPANRSPWWHKAPHQTNVVYAAGGEASRGACWHRRAQEGKPNLALSS